MKTSVLVICIVTFGYRSSFASEYDQRNSRYNPSTDFLLHEGGVISQNGPQKTHMQSINPNLPTSLNTNNKNYAAQFPALGPTSANSQTQTTVKNRLNPANGKRDYVAPQFPTLRPVQSNNQPSTGKVDFSPSQFPTLKPTQQTNQPGKLRDYVNPQHTTIKPALNNQQSTGKVKDLINFYDSKNKDQNTPQGAPSYSSILQGSTNKNGPSLSTTSPTPKLTQPTTASTPKPLSFSSVVSGNKPSTVTTPKPSTRAPGSPTLRPGSTVLPSSIVNNNRGGASGNSPSDSELQILSEELLRKDTNNAAKYITINYQERTTSYSKEDKAPRPLITVSPEVWNISTIQKLVPLLDNYERNTMTNEYVTPQERNEENSFMDDIMSTSVMRHLMIFLKNKGYVTPDPRQQRDFVKQLWFSLYSRGKGKISSSGFEHVFLSEQKNEDVIGLHNWIYFTKEEAANRVNYLGHMKYAELNDKGAVLLIHFNYQGADKPVNSLFVGTSPELEIALYTLCFVTRADNDCKLKLANKDIDITTHTFRYRGKKLIGSAYPSIRSV